MKVKDLMTVNVASVGPEATLKQVARLMTARGVSGIPVIDAGRRVLGVVSEADIIVKATGLPKTGRLRTLFARKALTERRLATTAGEAMSAPAVTIDAERPVAEAARLMVDLGVNRLPVVVDGRLAGIVSRADLVRVFTRSDSEIWEELVAKLIEGKLGISPEELDVGIVGGHVTLTGHLRSRMLAELVEALSWSVVGVVSVDSSAVTWEVEDRARRASGVES